MKESGIARRVDQLGRIVLPMEIRKRFKIVEGTLLNLSCEGNTITLEKYSPLLNFKEYVIDILNICDTYSFLVCDDTSVILGNHIYKQLVSKSILSNEFEDAVKGNLFNGKFRISDEFVSPMNYHLLFDIVKDGDKYGYLLFSFNNAPNDEVVGECKFICKYISSKL